MVLTNWLNCHMSDDLYWEMQEWQLDDQNAPFLFLGKPCVPLAGLRLATVPMCVSPPLSFIFWLTKGGLKALPLVCSTCACCCCRLGWAWLSPWHTYVFHTETVPTKHLVCRRRELVALVRCPGQGLEEHACHLSQNTPLCARSWERWQNNTWGPISSRVPSQKQETGDQEGLLCYNMQLIPVADTCDLSTNKTKPNLWLSSLYLTTQMTRDKDQYGFRNNDAQDSSYAANRRVSNLNAYPVHPQK